MSLNYSWMKYYELFNNLTFLELHFHETLISLSFQFHSNFKFLFHLTQFSQISLSITTLNPFWTFFQLRLNSTYTQITSNCITVKPRFWQLVGAAKMCCQNRVLAKSDNEWNIAKNSRTNFFYLLSHNMIFLFLINLSFIFI